MSSVTLRTPLTLDGGRRRPVQQANARGERGLHLATFPRLPAICPAHKLQSSLQVHAGGDPSWHRDVDRVERVALPGENDARRPAAHVDGDVRLRTSEMGCSRCMALGSTYQGACTR